MPQLPLSFTRSSRKGSYFAFVYPGSATSLESALFLTYPSGGNIRELTVFTYQEIPLFDQLKQQTGAEALAVEGLPLLKRMRDVLVDNSPVVAISPGSEYGIRLDRSMVLNAIVAAAT